ncbi:YeeE/YedE family protein [Silicimonas sp. MF1-12-2]|uniref:YeeE/YedE family protein n=1 Tax=Silicimonas sp. MF1-12-2 TaxID=3384793 RepID=UPI0039B50CD2
MLFEIFETEISPIFASVLFGALLGLLFGAAAQVSRFCLRRGLVGGRVERSAALGVWLTALLAAIVGTQAIAGLGIVDFSDHRFATSDVPVLAILLGGLLFGVGMVLTRGCVSRLTVLSATGNLRAVFVIATFAIVAHATLKGVLSPVRVAIGAVTVETGDAALLSGLPGGIWVWGGLLVALIATVVLRSGARPRDMMLAALIGALVPLGWVGTGFLLYDEFDPIALESLSFTAPWSETLFWTIASTSIPAGFGTGLVAGVIAGSFLAAAARGDLKLVSFSAPDETLRYLAGGALMGFGGVLAGGCTVGAGLSGVGMLSVAALLALGAIMVGGRVTDRLLDRRPTSPVGVPAE